MRLVRKELFMRHILTAALGLIIASSAAGQSVSSIRRQDGRTDTVIIRLDSARQAVRAAQGEMLMLNRTQRGQDELNSVQFARADDGMAAAERSLALAGRAMTLRQRTPRLGVTLSYEARETDRFGAYVSGVTPGSPADHAGIVAGDVITRIGSRSLARDAKSAADAPLPMVRATEAIAALSVGKPVEVELRRGTQTRTVRVTPVDDAISVQAWSTTAPSELFDVARDQVALTSRLQRMGTAPGAPGTFSFGFNTEGDRMELGMSSLFARFELAPMNEKLGTYFGATEGVLVVNEVPSRTAGVLMLTGSPMRTSITARSTGRAAVTVQGDSIAPRAAPEIPLEPGDVIISVDGRKVTTPSQLMRIVGTYDRGEEFKLQVVRQKRQEAITVKMP
jgi:S1-C subfamily serine protease